ncbi:MAG: hypothetical protein AABX49_00785, partial [Nanoarchaeota archaeon]
VDNWPLDSDMPGLGAANTVYNFATTQNLTTGTTTNSLNPFWFIGGRIAYIESDANFANGGIYIKNLRDLTQARRQLTTGLDAQLRELTSTPRGAFVYFHDTLPNGKTGIYKINRLNGNVTRAVPLATQTLDYSIRNPSVTGRLVINTNGDLDTTGTVWLVTETDNPTTATGQIYAYKLQTTALPLNPGFANWDGTTVRQVTNFTSGNRMARPKTSRDGDKIMFQEINNVGKTRLMVYNGLQNILANSTNAFSDPFGPSGDIRGDALTFFDVNYGVAFPGGFGGASNLIYFAQDQSDIYRLTNPLNFAGADFDIVIAPVGVDSSTGRFGTTSVKKRIPLPGNQITPAVSKEGRRLAFADDYLSDGVPGGNFNLYAVSCAPLIRIRQNMDTRMLDGFVDPSGLTFYGGRGDQEIDLGSAVPDDGYSTNTLAIVSPLK